MRSSIRHEITAFTHLEPVIAKLLSDPPKFLLISAPAGFGKSVFTQIFKKLAGENWRVFDGVPDVLPLNGLGPVLLACRPEEVPKSIDRMRLYGEVEEIGPNDLLFPKAHLSAEVWDQSCGWPVLVRRGAWHLEDSLIVRFLVREVLADLPFGILVKAGLKEELPEEILHRIPPLAAPETAAGRRLTKLFDDALVACLLRKFEDGSIGTGERMQLWRQAVLMERMLETAVSERQYQLAVELFEALGGWYLFYQIGPVSFEEFVSQVPDEIASRSDELILGRCIIAVKQGEVGRSRRLLANHFDPRILDAFHCLSESCTIPLSARVFRVVLLVYEDAPGSDRLHSEIRGFLSNIPLDQNLFRGSCYNCLVDHFIKLRRYEEAKEAAFRANRAYEKTGTPLLNFYIALHSCVLNILRGETNTVEVQIGVAQKWLDKVPFESKDDARLLNLVRAVLAFEKGDAAPMLHFIEKDMENLEVSETWPALDEFMVQFGALALASEYSTRVALNFVDHWSHTRMPSRTFRVMSEVRRVRVLQNANRWGEAAQALTTVQASIDRVWIESAVSELKRLNSRDQIAVALCWLRQIAYEQPGYPFLSKQLDEVRLNPKLSGRQRLAIDLWSAFVARRTGDVSNARSLVQTVFEKIAQQQTLSALHEEKIFLQELVSDKRISSFLKSRPSTATVLMQFETLTSGFSVSSARKILTRQEFKMLSLLTEGASNKLIARRLDLSESTVKFHLKNLFRKLGCHRRSEVVEAARALGWIS